jgi:hypothetical protein
MAACGGSKSPAADSASPDTTVAAAPAPLPSTTTPDTTLPVMLPPVANSVMKAGAPIMRPLPAKAAKSAAKSAAKPPMLPKQREYTTDTLRGVRPPVRMPNDARPSIPNTPPRMPLGIDSTRKLPPR